MGGGEVMLERLAGLAPLVGAHVDLGLLFGRSVPLAPALRARFRRVGCFDFPRRLRLAEASGLRRNHRALAGWLTGEPTRACVSMTFATAVRGALATLGTPTALMWMCNFSVRTAGWWPTAKRSAALRCLGLSGAIAVCPSLVTRAELASLGYPDSQLRVINNGVDLARYAPRPVSDEERQHFRGWFRARHGVPAADLVAVCTARIDPIKNHEVLIQAVAAAGRQGVRVALVCLGDACGDDAGYPARLLARCEELGVRDRVLFVGRSDEVPSWLAACDVAVLASHSETASLGLIEAAAAGLPLLASNVGSAPELALAGRSGYLFSPNDAAACARHLVELALDARQRQALGAGARRIAERDYDSCAMDRRWVELLTDLLARPHPSGAAKGLRS